MKRFRRRQRRRGMIRIEVQVRREDAPLIRRLVKSLSDDDWRKTHRKSLVRVDYLASTVGLKALLAAAPLEGIDLRRSRDRNRPIRL
ncbi:MAG: hypothetical protein FJX65_17560 [Alphaproteobacteria bacterium]|nr:hypothetical protein [Alphaproteobacteria bacterium]